MQKAAVQASRELKKPVVEDMAISNLLEIDFKDQEDSNIWVYHRPKIEANRKSFSLHQHKSNSNGTNIRQFAPIINLSNSQKEDVSLHSNSIKAGCKLNKGQFWSSKIAWMTTSQHISMRQYSSQPKLNKKYTFGYEVNGRKRRNKDDGKGVFKNQYKTNLMYSVLNHKDIVKYKEQSMGRLKKSIDINKNNKLLNSQAQIMACQNQQPRNTKLQESIFQNDLSKIPKAIPLSEGQPSQRNLMMIKQLLVDLQFMRSYQDDINVVDKKLRVNRWNIKKSMVKIQ